VSEPTPLRAPASAGAQQEPLAEVLAGDPGEGRWRSASRPLASLLGAAVLLQVFSLFAPSYIFPGWEDIGAALLDLEYSSVLVSIIRIAIAMLMSFVLGTLGAVLLYTFRRVGDYVLPVVTLIMAVPAVSWVMFAILWFGNLEVRIVFVLAVTCAPIFLVDILDGMRGIPREWRDMVMAFRPKRREYITKAILPAVVPAMLTSWKVNASLAVRVVTIAELVGAVSGIGYGLFVAQQVFDVAAVYAWTLVIVAVLLAMTFAIQVVEKRMLRWRHEG
jgi:ABC-type nitrate/sulfonate/bicarbonate transport system permease component